MIKKIKKISLLIIFLLIILNLTGCSLFVSNKSDSFSEPGMPTRKIKIVDTCDGVKIESVEVNENNIFGYEKNYKVKFKVDANYSEVQFWFQLYDAKQEIVKKGFFQLQKEYNPKKIYVEEFKVKTFHKQYDILGIGFKKTQVIDNENFNYIIVCVKGESVRQLKVKKNTSIPYIEGPDNEYLSSKGLFYDSFYNREAKTSDIVTDNILLFNKVSLDISVINKIQTDIIKANVTILVSYLTYSSQGSGVVVQEEDNGYFIITNNHVVSDENNAQFLKIEVKNYRNESVRAKLLYKMPSHDLALIWVNKPFQNVKSLKFAEQDPQIGDQIIAIGQPNNQTNTVTTGYVQGYEVVNFEGGGGPLFKTIKHTAPIDHGSSGGVLLNSNLKICGINFAGSTGLESDTPQNFAIQVSKIRELIHAYNESIK